jgi:hypothetical protein
MGFMAPPSTRDGFGGLLVTSGHHATVDVPDGAGDPAGGGRQQELSVDQAGADIVKMANFSAARRLRPH